MKALFLDHECHARTKSADFFIRVLEDAGCEVQVFRYSQIYKCKVPRDLIAWADVVVIWEFLPSRFSVGIAGKPCVFVPMYDNEWASRFQWRRIAKSGMAVVSFSERISRHARRCGVERLLAVQYFPEPSEPRGDGRIAFLRERGAVDGAVAQRLFAPGAVKINVVPTGAFLPADEYKRLFDEAGIFIAPRLKEGIGMAFLEAMAAGKCVVAHRDATMDEYIADGENGILADMRHPEPIPLEKIDAVHGNIAASARSLREKWISDRAKIAPFVAAAAHGPAVKSPWRVFSLMCFFAFIIEGALMRLGVRRKGK